MMAKTFRLTSTTRAFNRLFSVPIRLGVAPKHFYLLVVRGRRSGRLRSTPVRLVAEGAERWLVAPYGEVGWVRNARAAGEVTLLRRGRPEVVGIIELGPEASGPVIKAYLTQVRIVQPYFDLTPDSPPPAFVGEAAHRPVFRLVSRVVRGAPLESTPREDGRNLHADG